MTEAHFIGHCEDECCGLGQFQYQCPNCDFIGVDYNIWWEQDSIYTGTRLPFKCSNCESQLRVKWNKNVFQYQVDFDNLMGDLT